MSPVIILFALSAMFLALAIWTWRMPERSWIRLLKADRNLLGIDYSKYNQKKIRSATIALLLVEAVCLFPVGLTARDHPVLAWVLMGCAAAAPIVYWFVFFVFCKKNKYRK